MLSSSPIGQRGAAPEATSVLLFALVVALLWFALARSGGDAHAADSAAGPAAQGPTGELGSVVTNGARN